VLLQAQEENPKEKSRRNNRRKETPMLKRAE
jgi:hypothetical protein